MRFRNLSFSMLAALSLVACGGGSADPTQPDPSKMCSDTYDFSPYWNIDGSDVGVQRLDGKVGVPFVAILTLRDFTPLRCAGLQSYALGKGITLPRGLSLDTKTGTISGTPLEAKALEGLPVVQIIFPGFGSGLDLLTTLVIDP